MGVDAVSPTLQSDDPIDEIGLRDDDVQLVLNLLANIPGLGVDRELDINDLIDSVDAVFDLGVSEDPAKVTASEKASLNDDYSGTLRIKIDDEASPFQIDVDFSVTEAGTAVDINTIVDDLNDAIALPVDPVTGQKRIQVGQSGGRLIFLHNDEVRNLISVSAVDGSDAAAAKLGLTGEERREDPSAYVARRKLTGAGDIDLPVAVSLDVVSFSPPDLLEGLLPEISIGIPDLSLDDFSLPGALNIDFGQLGDLVIQFELNPVAGLGEVEEFLEDILSIPEDPNSSDAELPDFAVFTVAELNQGLTFEVGGVTIDLSNPDAFPTAGIIIGGQLRTDLDSFLQAIQGDEVGTVEVSLDRVDDQLAVRIDLGMELFQQREIPIQLDLSNLPADQTIPGLSDLVDFNVDSAVDVRVGALIGLSLGIDLTHEEGIKPFLYDVEQSGSQFTGTRLELKPRLENTEPINFLATVGPLGVQVDGDQFEITAVNDVNDTFEIASIDADANTVTVLTAPTSASGTFDWSIHRDGDFEFLLGLSDLDLSAAGQGSATLPISFPGLPLSDTITSNLSTPIRPARTTPQACSIIFARKSH